MEFNSPNLHQKVVDYLLNLLIWACSSNWESNCFASRGLWVQVPSRPPPGLFSFRTTRDYEVGFNGKSLAYKDLKLDYQPSGIISVKTIPSFVGYVNVQLRRKISWIRLLLAAIAVWNLFSQKVNKPSMLKRDLQMNQFVVQIAAVLRKLNVKTKKVK